MERRRQREMRRQKWRVESNEWRAKAEAWRASGNGEEGDAKPGARGDAENFVVTNAAARASEEGGANAGGGDGGGDDGDSDARVRSHPEPKPATGRRASVTMSRQEHLRQRQVMGVMSRVMVVIRKCALVC
jgi:hypothetical protein